MHKTILPLILFFVMPLLARAAEHDVTFTTDAKVFAIISTATGKVSRSGPFVSVALDRYTISANPQFKTSRKVLGYKVGLAFSTPDGKWDTARWSELASQSFALSPGDTKLVENVKFLIPADNLHALKDYWLVLAVETEDQGTIGYSYAHSSKGLL